METREPVHSDSTTGPLDPPEHDKSTDDPRPGRHTARRFGLLLPLGFFAGLAGLFFYALLYGGDPSKLPSALIGKTVPAFSLPPLAGLERDGKPVPGFSDRDLKDGRVRIVNFWASWCPPCIQEHPYLVKLKARSQAPLFGINYKDKPAAARAFLWRLTNPFDAVGTDSKGRVGIDFGVYGLPETYVINGQGRIVFKYVGPINERIIKEAILPAIDRARRGG